MICWLSLCTLTCAIWHLGTGNSSRHMETHVDKHMYARSYTLIQIPDDALYTHMRWLLTWFLPKSEQHDWQGIRQSTNMNSNVFVYVTKGTNTSHMAHCRLFSIELPHQILGLWSCVYSGSIWSVFIVIQDLYYNIISSTDGTKRHYRTWHALFWVALVDCLCVWSEILRDSRIREHFNL